MATASSILTITLPPAVAPKTSVQSSSFCHFPDRNSLFTHIESSRSDYNISLLVQTCPGVCPLVYGNGNPDISGPGAMISYTLQAILTIDGARAFKTLLQPTRKVAYSVIKTSIFVSLSVTVAGIIRKSQNPERSEHYLIEVIIGLQSLVSRGNICSVGTSKYPPGEIGGFWTYTILASILGATTSLVGSLRSSRAKILQSLIVYCATEREYPTLFGDTDRGGGTDRGGRNFIPLAALFLGPVAVHMLFVTAKLFANGVKKTWPMATAKSRALLKTHMHVFRCAAVLMLTMAWLGSVIFSTTAVWLLRKDLQRALGPRREDSEWGFGQTTAVLVWAPVLHDMIYEFSIVRIFLRTFRWGAIRLARIVRRSGARDLPN